MKKYLPLFIALTIQIVVAVLAYMWAQSYTESMHWHIQSALFFVVFCVFAINLYSGVSGWPLFGIRGVAMLLSIFISTASLWSVVDTTASAAAKNTEIHQARLETLQQTRATLQQHAQHADPQAEQRLADAVQRLATVEAAALSMPNKYAKYMGYDCFPKSYNGQPYATRAAQLCPEWQAIAGAHQSVVQQARNDVQRLQQAVADNAAYQGLKASVADAEQSMGGDSIGPVVGAFFGLIVSAGDATKAVLLVIVLFLEFATFSLLGDWRKLSAGKPSQAAEVVGALAGVEHDLLEYATPGAEAALRGAKPSACPFSLPAARKAWKQGYDNVVRRGAFGLAVGKDVVNAAATDVQQPATPATIQRATFSATDKSRNGDAPQAIMLPHTMRGDFNMLHAGPGAGKSMLAFGMAYAMATGGEFLKWRSNGSHRILVVDGEMGAALVKQRIETMGIAHPNIEVLAYDNLSTEDFPYLHTARGQAVIDAHMEGVDVLILDNLGVLTDDAYHSSTEWGRISQWIKAVTARGVAVWLIHHDNKSAQADGRLALSKMLATQYQLQPVDTGGKRLIVDIVAKKHRRFFGEDAETFRAEFVGGKWVVESGRDKNRVMEPDRQPQPPQNNVVKLRQLSALKDAAQADIIAQAYEAAMENEGKEPSYAMICRAANGLGYAVDKSYLSRNKGLLPSAKKLKNTMGFVG